MNHAPSATEQHTPILRMFEFVVAPAHVHTLLEAGRTNIEASVRSEPGVLAMFCSVAPDTPGTVYVVEVYRDPAAYQAHVETEHFKAFMTATKDMVIAKRLMQTLPAVLGAKSFHWPSES